ncbi:hypothetical protein ABH935_001448 [Catenulispora sp. GAS73]|uniref:hypothetical protein n=1 Tax=Catenulispora sp. GAS73 TaxID=3156269 RepID=UPI003515AF74
MSRVGALPSAPLDQAGFLQPGRREVEQPVGSVGSVVLGEPVAEVAQLRASQAVTADPGGNRAARSGRRPQ